MEIRAFLATVPLFTDTLSEEQLTSLAKESRAAFFRPGTLLMSQGDFGGSMFVIVRGEVRVTFLGEDAREQSVATLHPGDVVGEMSLFTGDRRTASVAAVGNVDAVEISKPSLERVFARAPELIDRFAAVLAKRQAELNAVSRSPAAMSRESFMRGARKVFSGIFRHGG